MFELAAERMCQDLLQCQQYPEHTNEQKVQHACLAHTFAEPIIDKPPPASPALLLASSRRIKLPLLFSSKNRPPPLSFAALDLLRLSWIDTDALPHAATAPPLVELLLLSVQLRNSTWC